MAMTTRFGYEELLNMPEDILDWYVERCADHHEKVEKQIEQAESGA